MGQSVSRRTNATAQHFPQVSARAANKRKLRLKNTKGCQGRGAGREQAGPGRRGLSEHKVTRHACCELGMGVKTGEKRGYLS